MNAAGPARPCGAGGAVGGWGMPERAAEALGYPRPPSRRVHPVVVGILLTLLALLVAGGAVLTAATEMGDTQRRIERGQADARVRGLKNRAVDCLALERAGYRAEVCDEPEVRQFMTVRPAGQ